MQNIKVTELGDGMLRLEPEKGYTLLNTITRRRYSVAEVRDPRPYVAAAL